MELDRARHREGHVQSKESNNVYIVVISIDTNIISTLEWLPEGTCSWQLFTFSLFFSALLTWFLLLYGPILLIPGAEYGCRKTECWMGTALTTVTELLHGCL